MERGLGTVESTSSSRGAAFTLPVGCWQRVSQAQRLGRAVFLLCPPPSPPSTSQVCPAPVGKAAGLEPWASLFTVNLGEEQAGQGVGGEGRKGRWPQVQAGQFTPAQWGLKS